MHELGIVQRVIEIAAEASGGARVTRIVLEIGKLSAILPDAVRFAFDLATPDTVAEGAVLEIIETPGRASCRSCRAQLVLDRPYGRCACGETDLEWLSGDELRIKQMEVA
ncbi:MAG TPA: hydrogenase maturation nickel metallochaperone HypA [Candidatus Methylomirabilis sp.]|nr:hydrogenase maturation nickel metallochaperone HypA [Candidatus Methylomirabilis sp.]